jgi:hypothetical protein
VGHASRSSDLVRVEASQVRISQSGIKTGGGTMAIGSDSATHTLSFSMY